MTAGLVTTAPAGVMTSGLVRRTLTDAEATGIAKSIKEAAEFGDLAPLRQQNKYHQELVKVEKAKLKAEGNVVSDREISFGCGAARWRPDIVYKTPDGQWGIIEVKTGDAGLSIRQSEIFPQIENGNAVSRGEVAVQFGLTSGRPLKEQGYPNGIPIRELRLPGLNQ
jgi:filamentous hemagglutinin